MGFLYHGVVSWRPSCVISEALANSVALTLFDFVIVMDEDGNEPMCSWVVKERDVGMKRRVRGICPTIYTHNPNTTRSELFFEISLNPVPHTSPNCCPRTSFWPDPDQTLPLTIRWRGSGEWRLLLRGASRSCGTRRSFYPTVQ